MFGKKKRSPSEQIEITDRTRKRTRTLSTSDLEMHMESILNRTLPEAFTLWSRGTVSSEEVDIGLEATLAIWDELVARQDTM